MSEARQSDPASKKTVAKSHGAENGEPKSKLLSFPSPTGEPLLLFVP